MKTLTVYDPAMCCSTGICGPQVDPVLVRFAADLKWLAGQHVKVDRYNLSQAPAAFVENATVRSILAEKGDAALPIVMVDDKPVAIGTYPERKELCSSLGLVDTSLPKLSLTPKSGGCCGGGSC
jgi:hypothetical protein